MSQKKYKEPKFYKTYSTPSAIREMQIKTPVRYHATSVRIAILKKRRDKKMQEKELICCG